jgi:hypothetical protein
VTRYLYIYGIVEPDVNLETQRRKTGKGKARKRKGRDLHGDRNKNEKVDKRDGKSHIEKTGTGKSDGENHIVDLETGKSDRESHS